MESNLKKYIKELIAEIEQDELDLEEATTTGDIAGYNTPNAFKDTDGTDEDEENDDKFVDKLAKSTGYERVDENRWQELRKDESSPKQKIGRGISGVNKQLSEIEKFVGWYGKIKKEGGLESDQYWKRTQKNLTKIRERLNRIATSIQNF
mgnify:FL=1|jgi:hypothetical protein